MTEPNSASRDRLLDVPRPQLQRQRKHTGHQSTFRQQSSGDTGLGSSLEFSPATTPVPNPQEKFKQEIYHRKRAELHQKDDEETDYELTLLDNNCKHQNPLTNRRSPLALANYSDCGIVSESFGDRYLLRENLPTELPSTNYYTEFNYEVGFSYPDNSHYCDHPEEYYYSEENELEHNVFFCPTSGLRENFSVQQEHDESSKICTSRVSRRREYSGDLPITSISEEIDRGISEMAYSNSAFASNPSQTSQQQQQDVSGRPRILTRTAGLQSNASLSPPPHQYEQRRDSLKPPSPRKGSLATPNSTWWKWSQQRRASTSKRQLEELDNESFEPASQARIPTPIMKAREESLRLAGSSYQADIPYASEYQKHRAQHASGQRSNPRKGKKNRKGKNKRNSLTGIELTMTQWNRLIAFWEHETFVRSRYTSLVFFIIGLILGIICVSVDAWSYHAIDAYKNSTAWSGIWHTCFENSTCTGSIVFWSPEWQKAVIGLMLFSLIIASMGSVLAILGICITYLPRKMYYYHSAGEVFFVSALATTLGLGIYPYAIQKVLAQAHYFGYGYGLGWASAGLLYLSAFTMMMDDLVRESSRPRSLRSVCCCCRRSNGTGYSQTSYPQPV